ncbi:unnamed protein product, partial [Polarella glacialis]
RVEWTINDFSARTRDVARNQALWSEKFTILGAADVQLEFFPQGRDSTAFPGFCALFLWCPAGVQMKYRLQVGKHFAAPDEDSYDMRMGHGHSNFCMLEAHVNKETDSLLIGLDILEIRVRMEPEPGLRLFNHGPEAAVARE